jgi:hypothetical protein
VIEVDPTNPDVVFAGGSFGYSLSPPSGGIFRSTDGGQTWVNLGWNQHPDFHALAFDPTNTKHVLVGSDGGVWFSTNLGGRTSGTASPLYDVDWQDLNGHRSHGTLLGRHAGQRHAPQVGQQPDVVRRLER